MYPGKRIQQSLHFWLHWRGYAKWYYDKDYNSDWWYFQTALHNPPSEKIVGGLYNTRSGWQNQLWEYNEI